MKPIFRVLDLFFFTMALILSSFKCTFSFYTKANECLEVADGFLLLATNGNCMKKRFSVNLFFAGCWVPD